MTIFLLTLRQLAAGKRWLVLVALSAVAPLLSLIDAANDTENFFLSNGFPDIVIGVVVPIIPLLLAGSAFASDMEEGTAVYVLAKPLHRGRILLEKYFAIVLVALLLTGTAAMLSLFLQSSNTEHLATLMSAWAAALFVGTLLYSALFLALSLITRRGLIIGLLYILAWESALAANFSGTRMLSVKAYMESIAAGLAPDVIEPGATLIALRTILFLASGLGGFALWLGFRRLQNFEVSEQS